MGHYRGRDNRKRRAARRRRNDAACERGRWVMNTVGEFGQGLRVAFHFLVDAARMAAQAMHQFAAGAMQFLGCSLIECVAAAQAPLPPAQPITLDELRRLCGGDGAALAPARFDAKGGFSLN